MAIQEFCSPSRKARRTAPRASVCLFIAATALMVAAPGPSWFALGESGGGSGQSGANGPVGLAQREATRRQQQIRNAQDLLTAAELDRREGKHADALEKYRTAFLSLPNVPASATLRDSIFKRYQQAAVEYARELIAEARWEQAESVLKQVMKDAQGAAMPAGRIIPEVRTLLARLRGDYYNKAMSPEHLANVETVESLLIKADGYSEIGDLTKAKRGYLTVLKIDRTNTAARRSLERVERMIMEYAEVARNHTRAAMLGEVAESWESPVPRQVAAAKFEATVVEAVGAREANIRAKLNTLILPQVEFVDTPLQTVVKYLTQAAREMDTAEPDPSKRGVNIVIDPQSTTGGADVTQRPVTLKLTNSPLGAVLQYVSEQAGMKFRVDDFAISIIPLSAADDRQLMTRTYRVPPNFISGTADAGGGGPVDPFAKPNAGGGGSTLVKRITALEFLKQSGVLFPEGSLASFNPINSTLVVRNTPDNISLIEQMILSARDGGSKLVSIEFKLLETTVRTLNELGFDWMLGQFNLGATPRVFAGGGVPGNTAGSRGPDDFTFVNPGGNPVGSYPVTSGLRTGDIKSGLTVDDVIARDAPSSVLSSGAAPGVLSVAGVFTDPQFQVILRALSQSKTVDLLSTASVVTKPGQRAVIKQVREFIYPTEYDPPQIPTTTSGGGGSFPVTPATPAAFETRELGEILEVEPIVGADNFTVDLNLVTDFTEFSGFVNYGSPIYTTDTAVPAAGLPFVLGGSTTRTQLTDNRILMPVFNAIKETTNVSVYDGQTVIVGGLLGEIITKGEDKVPLLGDAPLIGRFFRSSVDERTKRALILFATVRILDPSGQPLNDLDEINGGSAPVAEAGR